MGETEALKARVTAGEKGGASPGDPGAFTTTSCWPVMARLSWRAAAAAWSWPGQSAVGLAGGVGAGE